ncbi:tail fiber domain-containing protein [Maribellus mangrovi]|uniref:tail fiber domain-containing protein n=1 Tax=Maribellus mangrovi TaxID=3133146 RepID=UPI0030EF5182
MSLQVYGKYGEYLTNGRIGIGDYNGGGFMTTKRVYFGEAGNNFDSDRLELCGSDGLYFTWGQGYDFENVIGKLDCEYEVISVYPLYEDIYINVSSFKFNTDVYAHGIIINSDERFKEDITPLDSNHLKLSEISPVSYNLKPSEAFVFPSGLTSETEKQRLEIREITEAKEKIKILEKERFGFLAQELQEVFPELVSQNDDGLYVDYLGILPLLVETIKKQQQQITAINELLNKN